MKDMYPIPDIHKLRQLHDMASEERVPSVMPHAYVAEGYLDDSTCDDIITVGMSVEAHSFPHCGADTRDFPEDDRGVLDEIRECALMVNEAWFGFDLNGHTESWLQTYQSGGDYQMHTDASVGMSRKLTAVALLSPETAYDGGVLRVLPIPHFFEIPRTRGTVVVFPSWLLHEVNPVTSGVRQTINMGFWGPEFR